ncbi:MULTISPECIES: DarT ssDNA thymidine ADP-ribosyltransferase family protein [unclassified Bradyrhizobium]|uniref:DarT ssDNA thymidine ADP-ribosyltransferase family protein n=1 Tax=unclassified Bradyrhizobium TaxID=2631580 RepID=UPI00291637B8|nr:MULTISPECIES: DarT ssDNA thymidine ADP-ribosyltransferase family protein [unclassified Bradyrhizobium]
MDLDHFLKEVVAKSTQQQRFFHFTDRSNLPLIRDHGLIATSGLRSRNLFDSVKTGGDAVSLDSDKATGTDEYVCLCFRANHPMAFVAMNDERKLDPVYLEIDPAVIKLPNVMITDAPSNQKGVERIVAATALDKLDLDVLYKRMEWKDPAVLDRLKIAEKYEILIPTSLDKRYIVGGL